MSQGTEFEWGFIINVLRFFISLLRTLATNTTCIINVFKGYYCDGDGTKKLCDVGKYGSITGLGSSDCSGLCDPGYFCPAGSYSRTQETCGAGKSEAEAAAVYCPSVSLYIVSSNQEVIILECR